MTKQSGCSMLKILTLLTGLWLTALPVNAKGPLQNPFSIPVFKPSKENKALYGGYRKKWVRMTGFELSSLHWNQFVAVFINKNPEVYRTNYLEYLRTSQDDYDEDDWDEEGEAASSKFASHPVGTIVAKEGFTSHKGKPGDPTFLVLMKKREKGYDEENGNWEYMKFLTDGTTLFKGNTKNPQIMAECAGCHINVADRDYIFSSFYSGSPRK